MKKIIVPILESLATVAFIVGLFACIFIWRETPATAFAVILIGLMLLACYVRLGSIETSLSEEKRYNKIWWQDRGKLLTGAAGIIIVAACAVIVANGTRIAVQNPERAENAHTTAIVNAMNEVENAVLYSEKTVSDSLRELEKRIVSSLASIVENMGKIAEHTIAVEKANADINILKEEIGNLNEAISGLSRVVQALNETNRKILQHKKTE